MIEVEDLTKYYGGKRAIHDLCFRIEKGEIVGFSVDLLNAVAEKGGFQVKFAGVNFRRIFFI